MALGNFQCPVTTDGAENFSIGIALQCRAQFGLMARTADLVEDDSTDIYIRIKVEITADERGDTPGHSTAVDHQYHRRSQHRCQCGIAVRTININPVEQTLVAFDQTNARLIQTGSEGVDDLIAGLGEKIQVVAGSLSGTCKPQRINIIRALLEGLHRLACLYQGGCQTH